jgi:Ser/Thr protein kinase RdoA (MazF antagonist)
MEASDLGRATAAAMSIVAALDLPVESSVVLHNSNRVTLRLTPCDVVARVARDGHETAQFEVDVARLLAQGGAPVGTLHPRSEPLVHAVDGFLVTLWTYYEPAEPEPSAADYAAALAHLHTDMRSLDVPVASFRDRIGEAERVVGDSGMSPDLTPDDRSFLSSTFRRLRRSIDDRGAAEQMLHGEPHPGNVLGTAGGPRFVDLETCCVGPVEFDLAHVPTAVANHYPDVDRDLLDDCRQLVLAMVAAWRWERGDQFPDGSWFGQELLTSLRAGPPWPTLDAVSVRLPGGSHVSR